MLTDLEKIALSAAAGKVAKKVQPLTPGKHTVDRTITLRIVGEVNKSADTDYTPTAEIPLRETLALLLRLCGATRETAKQKLIAAMTKAIDTKQPPDLSTELADIDEAMKHVQDVTAALPKKTRTGPTNCKVVILEGTEQTLLA